MIRKEARRILAAGKASAEGSARHGGAVAAAAGFALEGAGLHFQRSWHEFGLWAFGREDSAHCERAPFTCGLLRKMIGATRTTVGVSRHSYRWPPLGCELPKVPAKPLLAGHQVQPHAARHRRPAPHRPVQPARPCAPRAGGADGLLRDHCRGGEQGVG